MAKLNAIINEVLYESSKKTLKVFYEADVFIQDFPEDQEDDEEEGGEEQQQQPPQGGEEGGEEAQQGGEAQENQDTKVNPSRQLAEDIFQTKVEGKLTIPEEKAKAILTLNDLLEYLKDQEIDNRPLMSELVIEVVLSLAGDDTQRAANEIISEGDKVNITLDYGFSKDDSIGLQVSKNPGVKMATLVMRKNGEPVTGNFSSSLFNQMITNVFIKEL